MKAGNIFYDSGSLPTDEFFETLLQRGNVRIERIVSHGQASPPGYWYDQDLNEWVILLRGSATIRFEDEPISVDLLAGDYLNIRAHRKHRVERTALDTDTVWLAVHY